MVTKHVLNKVVRIFGVEALACQEALTWAVFKETVHALNKIGLLLGVGALKAWRRSLRVLPGVVL